MSALADILAANHYPLNLVDGRLHGTGIEFLAREAGAHSFFLVGEEHGIGDILDFTTALFYLIQPAGYRAYVSEIGPHSAAHVNRLLGAANPLAAFRAYYARYPFSIPFAWFEEEIRLLRAVAAVDPGAPAAVLGIDQEFIFSPQLHLETLRSACSDPRLAGSLSTWLAGEQDGIRAMYSGQSPDSLAAFMNQPLPEEWTALRQHFTTRPNPAALKLLDALEASHAIYMHYKHERYYLNNYDRSVLMRRYFYRAYQDQIATQPATRFLIKLGANHVERGHSAMGIQDIGNFIAELGYMTDSPSFHLLVLAVGGTQNAWLPFLPAEYKAAPLAANPNPAYEPVIRAADSQPGWSLFDLRPLRPRQNAWGKDNPGFKKLLLGYDAVLVMKDVHAATLVVA